MQCVACNQVFPTDIDTCPHCQKPDTEQTASSELALPDTTQTSQASSSAMTDNSNVTPQTTLSTNSSTLIEFPGANRNRPAWRKELSERFREIQQRRAREASLEDEEDFQTRSRPVETEILNAAATGTKTSETPKQLGLVPPPDEPEINPIVAAALQRVERARAHSNASSAAHSGSGRTQAATAAARVIAEQPEQEEETKPAPSKRQSKRADKPEASADQTRTSTLVVVPSKQIAKPAPPPVEMATEALNEVATVTATATTLVEKIETPKVSETTSAPALAPAQSEELKPQPRHLSGVIDEFWLERQGIELLPKVAIPEADVEDRAPRLKRLTAGIIDLIAIAFLSAPFAALIELTIGNWNDPRVSGSMAGIVAVVMFLYHTCSIALAGRTWGMSFCALHTVDAKTATAPTTGQCMRRALVYMISLAAFGLGLLYSLFDAEGRTVPDLLSGTVVLKK